MEINAIHNIDCLEGMKELPGNSIDLVLTDPPYNLTKNKWDNEINFINVFKLWWSLLKETGPVVMTSQQPFTTKVICSDYDNFRYELVWKKGLRGSGFLNAKKMPLRNHENILIFYRTLPTYNPQYREGKPSHRRGKAINSKNNNYGGYKDKYDPKKAYGNIKFPLSVINFDRPHPPIHPTQKPILLMEYLIKTYSNEGDTILDPFIGSGTTALACLKLNRKFIGYEISKEYCEIAEKRIEGWRNQTRLPGF